ncbi:MAG: TlpA family protein disulfide reductase [Planctomycetales bacterium]|nr:TlpA family protein disulfide reductase [Planctomycetales bacterium]
MPTATSPTSRQRAGSASSLVSLLLVAMLVFGAVLLLRRTTAPPSGLGQTQGPNHPSVGQQLNAFDVHPLLNTEREITLESLSGKITLVNFWATWCGPCIMELPELIKMGRELAEEPKFQLLFVTSDDSEVEPLRDAAARVFRRETAPEQPLYHDVTADAQRQVATSLNIPLNFPTTLIVDHKGIVRGVWEGTYHGAVDEMKSLTEKLLHEAP